MWRRIVQLFHRHQNTARNARIDALFAETVTAHERAAQAAEDVARASDSNRQHLEQVRDEIAERVAAERRMRPQPHTSHVRHVVEAALARVQPCVD